MIYGNFTLNSHENKKVASFNNIDKFSVALQMLQSIGSRNLTLGLMMKILPLGMPTLR